MTNRHSAYTVLLMRHRRMLWRMCLKRASGDHDRCQDMLQEVSIALWENFDKLRPDASPRQERAWVCWQARSVFYQIERRHTLATEPIAKELADSLADDESQHRKELVEELLSALSSDDRHIVQFWLEGYSGDEIGDKMGISRDNVYQRMRRIILKLRRLAFILLALLLTSSIAVAVVPQWKRLFFNSGHIEETVVDTVPELTTPEPRVASTPPDTVILADSIEMPARHRMEPLEMPLTSDVIDMLVIEDPPGELQPVPRQNKPTVLVKNSRLIISGVDGELVKVYCGGKLLAAQKAGCVCLIDLFPIPDAYGFWHSEYTLQIGTRPAILLEL